ncbi:MAG: hypothetical protein IPG23_25355 [Burkholderiales bacterium]|nr:hypothetical protein [Burkholderiales bacterium]
MGVVESGKRDAGTARLGLRQSGAGGAGLNGHGTVRSAVEHLQGGVAGPFAAGQATPAGSRFAIFLRAALVVCQTTSGVEGNADFEAGVLLA